MSCLLVIKNARMKEKNYVKNIIENPLLSANTLTYMYEYLYKFGIRINTNCIKDYSIFRDSKLIRGRHQFLQIY